MIEHCITLLSDFKSLEIFTESFPQLVFQCYLATIYFPSTLHLISILTSTISILAHIVTWLPKHRNQTWIDPTRHSWASLIPTFLWYSSVLVYPCFAAKLNAIRQTGSVNIMFLVTVYFSPPILVFVLITLWCPKSGRCWRVTRTSIHVLLYLVLGFMLAIIFGLPVSRHSFFLALFV